MACGPCSGSCGGGPPGSVLAEIVIADERDARALAGEAAATRRWTGVDALGLDQVKLATLWALLANEEYRDELVYEFAPLHELSEEGPWVFRVPAPLVERLADLDDGGAAAVAPEWAGTEALELDGWDAGMAGTLLGGLRSVARAARCERRALLMRVSLS